MITIGIDPGLDGAVAALRDGQYLAVADMPVVAKGSGAVKREVNPAGLRQFVAHYAAALEGISSVIERVNAMPGQGVSSVFSLGDSFGSARAALACSGIEVHYVAPASWKAFMKLPRDKEASRALASRLFPSAPLELKKHDGRAEALLLARWLWETKFK